MLPSPLDQSNPRIPFLQEAVRGSPIPSIHLFDLEQPHTFLSRSFARQGFSCLSQQQSPHQAGFLGLHLLPCRWLPHPGYARCIRLSSAEAYRFRDFVSPHDQFALCLFLCRQYTVVVRDLQIKQRRNPTSDCTWNTPSFLTPRAAGLCEAKVLSCSMAHLSLEAAVMCQCHPHFAYRVA